MYNHSPEEGSGRVSEVYNATGKGRSCTNGARKRVLVEYHTLVMPPGKGSSGRVGATIGELFGVPVSFSLFVALAFLSDHQTCTLRFACDATALIYRRNAGNNFGNRQGIFLSVPRAFHLVPLVARLGCATSGGKKNQKKNVLFLVSYKINIK